MLFVLMLATHCALLKAKFTSVKSANYYVDLWLPCQQMVQTYLFCLACTYFFGSNIYLLNVSITLRVLCGQHCGDLWRNNICIYIFMYTEFGIHELFFIDIPLVLLI